MCSSDLVSEIRCVELKEWIESGRPLQLVDVREPHELEICRINPCRHIPLGQLEARWAELDPKMPTVLVCRSGKRSAVATNFLLAKGFQAQNLVGGVLAWGDEVDPSFPKY